MTAPITRTPLAWTPIPECWHPTPGPYWVCDRQTGKMALIIAFNNGDMRAVFPPTMPHEVSDRVTHYLPVESPNPPPSALDEFHSAVDYLERLLTSSLPDAPPAAAFEIIRKYVAVRTS